MSSKIFNALLEEKIENLISAYQNTSRTVFFDDKEKRLIHSGEFGAYREKLVKEFLRFVIPQKVAINNGFIISSTDEISTQCDIIIYDHNVTPLIQSNELQTFYPVETVVGVGEVKSKLSRSEFVTAINKLARIKEIKSRVPFPGPIDRNRGYDYNCEKIPFDNIFTFIFCEKFNFKYDTVTGLNIIIGHTFGTTLITDSRMYNLEKEFQTKSFNQNIPEDLVNDIKKLLISKYGNPILDDYKSEYNDFYVIQGKEIKSYVGDSKIQCKVTKWETENLDIALYTGIPSSDAKFTKDGFSYVIQPSGKEHEIAEIDISNGEKQCKSYVYLKYELKSETIKKLKLNDKKL